MNMSDTNDPNFSLDANSISISEAAEKLGVTTKTIRNWEEKGKIETVRTPGGHRRIPLFEIDRLQGRTETFPNKEEPHIMTAPSISELEPLITPTEYEQFLKKFGLDQLDCLQPEKADIELLPEVGFGIEVNRDHVNFLTKGICHKIENVLNVRLTDSEYLRINNIVSEAHSRSVKSNAEVNDRVSGIPVDRSKTLGYLRR